MGLIRWANHVSRWPLSDFVTGSLRIRRKRIGLVGGYWRRRCELKRVGTPFAIRAAGWCSSFSVHCWAYLFGHIRTESERSLLD